MADIEGLLSELQEGLSEIERLDEPARGLVIDFLDRLEELHRTALQLIGDLLGDEQVERLRESDPAVAWLLHAYGIGLDERAEAELALDPVRPYIHSHGGEIEVLAADGGVVRVRLTGSCSGCTASAVTLKEGVERALAEGLPGFARLDVEEETGAEAHPPPGATLLQLENRLD